MIHHNLGVSLKSTIVPDEWKKTEIILFNY